MSQEQKPRKVPRKKTKLSAMIRPGKRNKKKLKKISTKNFTHTPQNKTVIYPNCHMHDLHQTPQQQKQFTFNLENDNQFLHQDNSDLMALANSAMKVSQLNLEPSAHLTYKTDDMILVQKSASEESSRSAHEHGLSESDIIGLYIVLTVNRNILENREETNITVRIKT
jgi:hypothetical protein